MEKEERRCKEVELRKQRLKSFDAIGDFVGAFNASLKSLDSDDACRKMRDLVSYAEDLKAALRLIQIAKASTAAGVKMDLFVNEEKRLQRELMVVVVLWRALLLRSAPNWPQLRPRSPPT